MDEFLNSLKIKEKELKLKLEESPLFRQLESLRNTIAAFGGSNGLSHNGNSTDNPTIPRPIYDSVNFTWRERILYIIKDFGQAGVAEIISAIQNLEPDVFTKAFLTKRVGVTVSQLKSKGELDVRMVGKKSKYFIK